MVVVRKVELGGQPDRWICMNCGAFYAHAVSVCRSEKCQSESWVRFTGLAATRFGDGYAVDPDIGRVCKKTGGKKLCFYCLREHDDRYRTCVGCGGTRFNTVDNNLDFWTF